MDQHTLDELLKDSRKKQFWLKPIGPPRDHPDWSSEESRTWTERQVEIHFENNPAKVAVGAVLIAFRVRYSKLIYIAERLPLSEWGQAEVRSEYNRRRWPYYIKTRNLTPEYGGVWNLHNVQPFPLATQFNEINPEDPARLGSIQRGNDKGRIPRSFAEMLIRQIRELA